MRSPLTGRSASCPLVRKSARGQGGPDGVRTCKEAAPVCVCVSSTSVGAARVLLYGIATPLGARR